MCCSATTAALTAATSKFSIPRAAAWLFRIVHKVHRIWKCCRITQEVTSSASNFGQFIAGSILNCTFGNRCFVKVPARIIFIARRVVDCVNAQLRFNKSYYKLFHAFSKPYPPPRRIAFNKGCKLLSPSSRTSIERILNAIIDRIIRIARTLFYFFANLFKLSMRYIDLIESISPQADVKDESVRSMFLNIDHLFKELSDHEPHIHELLHSIGAQYDAQAVTKTTSFGIGIMSKVYRGIVFVKNKVVQFFRWMVGLNQSNEMCSKTPASLKNHHFAPISLDKKTLSSGILYRS